MAKIVQHELGSLKNFVYLILDESSKTAAWVDCQNNFTAPAADLKQGGYELTHILLTHTHHDHIAGLDSLLSSYPKAKLCFHQLELFRLKLAHSVNPHFLSDGEEIQLGSTVIQALHTPGHSHGELSFFIPGSPPALLSGDTVFIRNCGRTDFETGSDEQMFHSLQRLKKLPPQTLLYPGHHYSPEYSSTLEVEWKTSPPFLCRSVAELAALP